MDPRAIIWHFLWDVPRCEKGLCTNPATRMASYRYKGEIVMRCNSCDHCGGEPVEDLPNAEVIRAAMKFIGVEHLEAYNGPTPRCP